MKKFITATAIVALFMATSASAHNVYNNNILDSKGQPTLQSVIPDDVWNAAMAKAMANIGFGQTNMVHVARGGYVVLKNGTKDYCPAWYPMGCVIDPSLVK